MKTEARAPETPEIVILSDGRDTMLPRPPGLASAILRSARPKQWIKNILVFAAPGAAGVLHHGSVLAHALGAFAVFCVAASGTYLLNDALDIEADRRHPTKRHRPVAAGHIDVTTAIVAATLLLTASVAGALAVGGWKLALVIAIYAALQPAYSVWLKHIAVVDLAAVASGFVLRAIAGGVAVDVPISQWFLIVACFGSLFIVAGKRHAEHIDLGDERDNHRVTLGEYSLGYLRYIRSVSSAVAIAAYCLWAFEKASLASAPLFFQLSILPFVLGVFRYALILESGQGADPENIVVHDRPLLALGAIWIALFAIGVNVS